MICFNGQFSDDTARISRCQYIRWDVFCDDTSCSNSGVVADGYSGEYAGVCSYPYIIPNGNRIGIFKSFIA